ncbi:hypothetical protein ANCDUO_25612, partial [Ancylostoma duodenale]
KQHPQQSLFTSKIRRNPQQLQQTPRVPAARQAPARALLTPHPNPRRAVPSSTIKGELSDPSTGSSTTQPSPPSASQSEKGKSLDSSSGNNRAVMKRQQKTEEFYSSSDEASLSAAKNEVKRKESSTRPRRRSKSRSRSASLTPPKPKVSDSSTKSLHHESVERQNAPVVYEKEFASQKSTPHLMSAVVTAESGAIERPASSLPATYATLAEHSTQTETRKESDSLP